jgi:hypothetical protein
MLFVQSDGSYQVYLSVPGPTQWVNLGNYASRPVAELVYRTAQKVESTVMKCVPSTRRDSK